LKQNFLEAMKILGQVDYSAAEICRRWNCTKHN